MVKFTINEELCKGCGLCVHTCPKKVLILDPDRLNAKGYNPSIVKFADLCIGCGMCGMICPDSAITVER